MSKDRILSSGVPDPVRHDSLHIDHVSHAKPGIKVFPDKLNIIAVISNPIRYRARYELYRAFEKHIHESGGTLYTVEMAFGGREFEISTQENPYHIQLRGSHELWHKENMINIALSRLPLGWKYVAWIDADITFLRPDWVQETLHQLQHYKVVQMFSYAQDVGPNYWQLENNAYQGFVYSYRRGVPLPYKNKSAFEPYHYWAAHGDMKNWHSGYAWAARREAIDHVGGLIDWAILGSSDHNMAAALVGCVQNTIHGSVHPNFMKKMLWWQELAQKHLRRDIGYVDGMIVHHWHGKKANRGYVDRWKILVDNQFDPEIDIKKDTQGLYQLQDHGDMRSINLRDDLRRYFRSRQEDSIDIG